MVQIFAADFERVNRVVRDKQIKLVIVDSAAMATGEPESADATAQYFRALAGLDTTTLTIAHVAKAGREREPFGSIFWRQCPPVDLQGAQRSFWPDAEYGIETHQIEQWDAATGSRLQLHFQRERRDDKAE